jgi:hypothetical protein
VLMSDGFKLKAKEVAVLDLVKKVRTAEEAIDFPLERTMLAELKAAIA